MLLDALSGLQAHLSAVVLIGAQAVYLRTAGRLTTYQAFTTDADLVIDPGKLADTPPLGEAMTAARFEYAGGARYLAATPPACGLRRRCDCAGRSDRASPGGPSGRSARSHACREITAILRHARAPAWRERSSTTTDQALSYLRRLFATPRSPGTRLAVQALTGVDEITVAAVITGYTRDLIGSSSG